MTYKSKEKSFFDDVFKKEIVETVEDRKEDLQELEKKGKKKFLRMYDFGASKLRDEVKRKPAQYFFLFITSFLGSVITTGAALIMFSGNLVAQFVPKPIAQVRSVQTTGAPKVVRVQKYDPLLLASKLRKKETGIILLDIRSKEEYKKGHIISSINVPIYGTNLINKNGDLNQAEVKKLIGQYLDADKLLILYGQNAYSTIPDDVVSLIYDRFPNAKALAIGWEEWVYLNK